ncbi:MAG: FAD-dependent oxidoreductase [Saprospiraceae bacterium]
MPPAHWYTGIVTDVSDLAPRTKSFRIKIPEVQQFDFKAGQFITFDLPVGEKRLQRWRSYSIASAPGDSNEIELCLVHFEQGLGSTYFFKEISIGSELKFKAPEGGFILPGEIDHDLVMICTGTGIAPFRSMIRDIFHRNLTNRNIHLIFGTRKAEDILYLDEWKELSNSLPGFRFDIALSREDLNELRTGGFRARGISGNLHSGYVHPIYLKQYTVPRKDVHFYICGWSMMIDEAVENLFGELHYERNQIHYELYG